MTSRRSRWSSSGTAFILATAQCVATASLFFGLATTTAFAQKRSASESTARDIYQATGVQGGFVVHLGCGDGVLTRALRVNDRYQVHGLDRDADRVNKARQAIAGARLAGPVSVDVLRGNELPYVDNLVNLLVAEDLDGVGMDEVHRVLVPKGVAYVKQDGKWKKTVKPRPSEIDEWTHFLYDASGNAVAHDTVVGPPRHLQWVGSPRWSRHHDRMASMSALVSTGGRMFYIMDEGSRISIQMPPKWKLIARDAFNGAILWKRSIPRWHSHLWPLKSGPTQLARRLVAKDDRVYVSLGIDAPLSQLDAATGETIREYPNSKAAEEILLIGDTVLVLVNRDKGELADYGPQKNLGDQRRVGVEYEWNGKPRELAAYSATTGRELWRHASAVAPLSLSADDERAYFHDGQRVVCLQLKDGKPAWTSDPVGRRPRFNFNFGPKVVVHDGVLLFAGGDRTMRAFDAPTGKLLWSAPHARGGYQSPEDLLVVGGLVWSAPTTSSRDTGVFTGRDLKTARSRKNSPPLSTRTGFITAVTSRKPPTAFCCRRERVSSLWIRSNRTGKFTIGCGAAVCMESCLATAWSTPHHTTAPVIRKPRSLASTRWLRRFRREPMPVKLPPANDSRKDRRTMTPYRAKIARAIGRPIGATRLAVVGHRKTWRLSFDGSSLSRLSAAID